MEKKVSMAVIKRLPRYYRYLHDLIKFDIERISSKQLSDKMGITASQIRQDLNCFGGFGQQGYGYNVKHLYSAISNILGTDVGYNAVIIGSGNMGNALANFKPFVERGFHIKAIFDKNPKKIGTTVNGKPVMDIEKLKEFNDKIKIDIAIITVPYEKTVDVANYVVQCGIKGIWNFSPTDLKFDDDIAVENVHLSDGLMVLGYKTRA